jgi:hypothetical protein
LETGQPLALRLDVESVFLDIHDRRIQFKVDGSDLNVDVSEDRIP